MLKSVTYRLRASPFRGEFSQPIVLSSAQPLFQLSTADPASSHQHPKASPLFAVADSHVGEAGQGVGDPVAAKDGKYRWSILFFACDNGVDIGGVIGPLLWTHGDFKREVGASK